LPRLALFDFDHTVTNRDMFTLFMWNAVTRRRLLLGGVLLSPLMLAFKVGALPASVLRRVVVYVGFRGRTASEVEKWGETFSRRVIPEYIWSHAIDRIQWHQNQGDTVVIVSASLNVYLEPWCRDRGLDLICSRLEVRRGVLTGRYYDGDCAGQAKAQKIRERYDLSLYQSIYGYGDSSEDLAMLDLAHKRFFRWKEI
jgi:phosphatidylglycerophosphatase C